MLDYVWRVVFEVQLRGPLSIEVVSNDNKIKGSVIG